MEDILDIKSQGIDAQATMYNRIEWVQYDENSNSIYFTETGRDNPAGKWADESTRWEERRGGKESGGAEG